MKRTKFFLILLCIFLPSLKMYAPDLSILDRIRNEKFRFKKEKEDIKQTQLEISKMLFYLAIGYSESKLNPLIVNKLGYVGLFQFGTTTRKKVGAPMINKEDIIYDTITKKSYLRDINIWSKEDQYMAMDSLIKLNEKHLIEEISFIELSNNVYKGHFVTKSGILAAAHLSGAGNVKKYFRTKGKYNPKDLYGTSLEKYLIKFSGFNI